MLQHCRPIAILPVICTVLEKIVCKQFQNYMEENDLYDEYRSA